MRGLRRDCILMANREVEVGVGRLLDKNSIKDIRCRIISFCKNYLLKIEYFLLRYVWSSYFFLFFILNLSGLDLFKNIYS